MDVGTVRSDQGMLKQNCYQFYSNCIVVVYSVSFSIFRDLSEFLHRKILLAIYFPYCAVYHFQGLGLSFFCTV